MILVYYKKLFKFLLPIFIEHKNSANEQNASLLASFSASAAYFRARQIGCLFILSRAHSSYATVNKEETDTYEYKKWRNDSFYKKYYLEI